MPRRPPHPSIEAARKQAAKLAAPPPPPEEASQETSDVEASAPTDPAPVAVPEKRDERPAVWTPP